MDLTYVIGEPGVGKSTLVAAAAGEREWTLVTRPFLYVLYPDVGVAELGPRKANGFSGTDGLSMSVQPKVNAWLETAPVSLILGEGDRMANEKFFTYVSGIANLTVVKVDCSREESAKRRALRAAAMGVPLQSEAWLKGRQTKIENLSAWVSVTVDSELPIEEQLRAVADVPVLRELIGAR